MRREYRRSAASVNISARQIAAGALPGQVDAALAESGLPPERLELELTESLLLAEAPEVAAMLHGLRDRGIALALDDFGAGYASFGRLRRLPFTTLKLDHSLVANLPEDAADTAILRAIRDLGRALDLRVVAEGVERPEQRDALIGLGFEKAQGYLFGHRCRWTSCAASPPPLRPSGKAPPLRPHDLSPNRRHRRGPRRPEPAPAPWWRAAPPSACSTRAVAPAAAWLPAVPRPAAGHCNSTMARST